ncbi:MAG: MFS transporter, partial [Chloroflexi bacterium]|nr:MFS transporter [Chloroflexota bacterium]
FKEMGESRILRGLFIYRLTFAMGREGAFFTFLPIFATLSLGLDSSLTGVLLAVNILIMSILQLYGGKLADRFEKRTLVTIGGGINIAFMALIPLTHNFWQLLGLSALGGIGGAISMPAASALSIEEGRKFGMGSTIALIFMAMSIGMVIGPILGGALAESTNIDSVFYFSAAVLLAGTGFFMRLTK